MGTKVRKQIYLEKRQDDIIKRESKALGMSEAEVIRMKIDSATPLRVRRRPDPRALQPFFDLIAKRKALGRTTSGWKWNREAIYEERLSRYGKRVSD